MDGKQGFVYCYVSFIFWTAQHIYALVVGFGQECCNIT